MSPDCLSESFSELIFLSAFLTAQARPGCSEDCRLQGFYDARQCPYQAGRKAWSCLQTEGEAFSLTLPFRAPSFICCCQSAL